MAIFTSIYSGAIFTFTTLFIYIPFSILILYNLQTQYLNSYFTTERLLASADETEQQASTFAGEFRGLMGQYLCTYTAYMKGDMLLIYMYTVCVLYSILLYAAILYLDVYILYA